MVIAGDYKGKAVVQGFKGAAIGIGIVKQLTLDNSVVSDYELITDEHFKSASSMLYVASSVDFYLAQLA